MKEYNSRDARHVFLVDRFGKYLQGSVMNVGGGGEKHLLRYVTPQEYVEIDVSGTPDLRIDLDREYPLPVKDNRYDTVICTDVLEHLEELHRVFGELVRISRRYVILSMPNALLGVRQYMRRTKYVGNSGIAGKDVGYFSKYYGLPVKKPTDRHRWFFSYKEAQRFFQENADTFGYRIIDEQAIGVKSSSVSGSIARFCVKGLFGEDLMQDLFYSVYWCVLEKRQHG
jgi:predicted SAM-dependent methyltransferase